MNQKIKDTSMIFKKKFKHLIELNIEDTENFEPPQQSSTPSKINLKHSKNILKDKILNISLIDKQDQKKDVGVNHENKLCKPILDKNDEHDRVPELFYSDPEEEYSKTIETDNTTVDINNSDDNWKTISDYSVDENCTNDSCLFPNINANTVSRFDKPPRHSYRGRKRSSISLFEDAGKDDEIEIKTTKCKKPKKIKHISLQEQAFIQSINDHFSDIESFSLTFE